MGKSFCGRLFGLVFVSMVLVSLAFPVGGNAAAETFSVKNDAFSISNEPGYCFAMAAFSRWYYLTKQGEPPLRKALDKKAQYQIAQKLQEFYSRNLITLQADYCNQHQNDQSSSFNNFVAGLASGEPRIVLLMNRSPKGAVLHAVLAYEWVPEKYILKVYDPNYNNEERVVDLELGKYTSLDITYGSICFPEVLHNHQAMLKKMEALYARFQPRRAVAASAAISRGPIASAQESDLKSERYPRGPTR